MNFLSMKYFTTVARFRSFTRAAAELKITQQTLSSHIAGVEKELGCTLLVRHVPLELTYAGEVFLRYATGLQKNYEQMVKELGDISENRSGVIRVGVGFTRGMAIMPHITEEFQKQWPRYEVQMVEVNNEEFAKLLADGEIDLAIGTFPEKAPDIEVRPFYREEIVLSIAKSLVNQLFPGKRKALADAVKKGDLSALAACPFVLGKPGDISAGIAHHFLRLNNLHPVVKARSDNIGTLLALSLLGVGACFCQANFIRMTLTPENIRQLDIFRLPAEATYEIRFGTPKHGYERKAVKSFMDTASQLISSPQKR